MSQYLTRNSANRGTGQLNVPVSITRAVPADARFDAEMTDEGILFRFVGLLPRSAHGKQRKTLSDVPAWAKDGAGHE